MGAIWGNKSSSIDPATADSADANFYSCVRTTIQNLDKFTLEVSLSGGGFLWGFLYLAGTLFNSDLSLKIWGSDVNIGRHSAWVVAGGAFVLACALYSRLNTYVDFLGKAVAIASNIERNLLDVPFSLTQQFETVSFAGSRGRFLLQLFLRGMLIVCLIAFLFFFAAAFFPQYFEHIK